MSKKREKCLTHTTFGGLLILMVTWGLPCVSECWRRQGNAIEVKRKVYGVITIARRWKGDSCSPTPSNHPFTGRISLSHTSIKKIQQPFPMSFLCSTYFINWGCFSLSWRLFPHLHPNLEIVTSSIKTLIFSTVNLNKKLLFPDFRDFSHQPQIQPRMFPSLITGHFSQPSVEKMITFSHFFPQKHIPPQHPTEFLLAVVYLTRWKIRH